MPGFGLEAPVFTRGESSRRLVVQQSRKEPASMSDELYVDTQLIDQAAVDMNQIAAALTSVSDLAQTALISLADYDSPEYSEELKAGLRRWINIVGDPAMASADSATMISRMKDFARFLQGVASSYSA